MPPRKAKAEAGTAGEIRIEYFPLDVIARWPRNPKLHADAAIDESLERFGFVAPAIRDERTKRLVAGHGRLDRLVAWQNQGKPAPKRIVVRTEDSAWLMPVVCGVSFDDEREAEAYLLADNQITMLRGYDAPKLKAIADDLIAGPGLIGTGFDEESVRAQMEQRVENAGIGSGEGMGGGVIDDAEDDGDDECVDPTDALVAKWKTSQGQLWEIVGPSGLVHRVLCGDCRNPADVERLLAGARVNVAFTSPPYASQRKYDEESGFKPIHPDAFVDWFEAVQANIRTHLAENGSWFVNIKPLSDGLDTSLYVLDLVISHVRKWGWHFATEFCWERVGIPGKPARRFKNQFEPIYQFCIGDWKFRPESVRHRSDSVPSYSSENHWSHGLKSSQGTSGKGWIVPPSEGLAYPGNRLQPFATQTEGGHSAAFPVALPTFFVCAYSDPGDAVYDPFLGSGTTVLAAEKTGRRGFGTELSAKYLAVILERMTQRGCRATLVP